MKFVTTYFELVGLDPFQVVNEAREGCFIYLNFNSNFIALIPKVENLVTFKYFNP